MRITLKREKTIPEHLPPLPPLPQEIPELAEQREWQTYKEEENLEQQSQKKQRTDDEAVKDYLKKKPKMALQPPEKPKPIDQNKIERLGEQRWIQTPDETLIGPIKKPKIKLPHPRLTLQTIEEEIQHLTREELEEIRRESLDGLPPNEIKPPVLLLMRSNGDIDTFQNVPDGLFQIKKNTGTEKEQETKGILLTNNRLHNWKYAGENIKTWIAFEDEATPYPSEVKHDSVMLVKFYEKILLNLEMLKPEGAGLGKWAGRILLALAIIAIIGYVAYKMGWIPNPQTVNQAVNATPTNVLIIPTT